jgi:hypothetical protein
MRAIVLAVAAAAIVGSAGIASAQYGDAVPISRNWRGELACPSNYVIRGNACVSIYAGRRAYRERRGFREGYARGGHGIPPRMNRRGEMQCPSNYVIRGGGCVSLY